MKFGVKERFNYFLSRLESIVDKTPAELFASSVADDMFSLEMNAKIAANFALRGYCPLIGEKVASFFTDEVGKEAVLTQISQTKDYLDQLPEYQGGEQTPLICEEAGFAKVELPPEEFLERYAFPNFLFHICMVYAIARANGVALSKADYDGIHSYPSEFSFVTPVDR